MLDTPDRTGRCGSDPGAVGGPSGGGGFVRHRARGRERSHARNAGLPCVVADRGVARRPSGTVR